MIERPSAVILIYRKLHVFADHPGLTVEIFEMTADGLVKTGNDQRPWHLDAQIFLYTEMDRSEGLAVKPGHLLSVADLDYALSKQREVIARR